jgi:AhpD family alkylhydroperoxidase
MNNYPEHLAEIKRTMGALGQQIPDTMQAFMGLHKAAASDGVLSAKVKELLALAIAVTVRCDGCIAFHVHDALQAGATREEIVEALGVAILMGGGPAVIYATQALTAVDQFEAERTPA